MAIIIDALPELEAVVKELTGKELATVNDVLEAFGAIKLNAEIVPVAEAAISLVEKLIATETFVQTLDILDEVVSEKFADLGFLFEDLDKALLIEDIETILEVAETLLEYGVVEFIYAYGVIDVTSEGAKVVNNAIYELANLNILEDKKEQLLEHVLSKVGVDDAEFDNYSWDEEIAELQDVVSEIYVLFEDNQYFCHIVNG